MTILSPLTVMTNIFVTELAETFRRLKCSISVPKLGTTLSKANIVDRGIYSYLHLISRIDLFKTCIPEDV